MPENEEQDVAAGAQAPAETALEKFERERLSRRQALKRFGMTSAMATFALFSVDDLARMVGKAMQQRAGDNKVAGQIAQEFQQAGIAFATGTSGAPCSGNYDCTGCGGSAVTGDCCAKSSDTTGCCGKSYGPSGKKYIIKSCQECCDHASPDFGGGPYDMILRQCYDMCGQIV